jgi:hypothetical protein
MHTEIEELLETVFSIGSASRLCSKHELDSLVSQECAGVAAMKSCKTVAAGNSISMQAEDSVGIHYMAVTVEATEDIEDLVCAIVRNYSALISEDAILLCSYDAQVSSKSSC